MKLYLDVARALRTGEGIAYSRPISEHAMKQVPRRLRCSILHHRINFSNGEVRHYLGVGLNDAAAWDTLCRVAREEAVRHLSSIVALREIAKHVREDNGVVLLEPQWLADAAPPPRIIRVDSGYWKSELGHNWSGEDENLRCRVVSVGDNGHGTPVYTFQHPERLTYHVVEAKPTEVLLTE